jgi:hypothetical protein
VRSAIFTALIMKNSLFVRLVGIYEYFDTSSFLFLQGRGSCIQKIQRIDCCPETFINSTLTEVFPCFFLSCKANARVKLTKTGHGQHSSKFVVCVVWFVIHIVLLLIVMFYVLFVCKCVLYHCLRVSTQLQLANISYKFLPHYTASHPVREYQ